MKEPGLRRSDLVLLVSLVLIVALIGSAPSPATAGVLQQAGITLKKNFGPQIMLDQTLFNVNLPLSISNMPGPWKNAKLKAIVLVTFMNAAGETIGYASGKGGLEDWTPLDVTLNNGGYSGTVVLPIQASVGTISGKTCCLTVVVAEQGNQHMIIGASKGGTAPNSGECADMGFSGMTPGTILPY